MKNLYLVQVVDSYGPNKFLPLAIAYQWLYAQQDPLVQARWECRDVLIEKLPINHWLESMKETPHLVAMSCYVWNWEYNQALARAIKQRWPDCVIVVGGPQVDKHDPALVRKNSWIDVAVLGENESAFRHILARDDPEQWKNIPGVVTKQTLAITQPVRTSNLDDIPSPILSGFYDWIIDRYPNKQVLWQVTYETMRGCPYHCQFCDVGDSYWNKIYLFDLSRVEKEIQWMAERKIEYVSVCDSNWGISARDKDITKLVIDAKLKHGYPKFWDVTWAKNNPDAVREIAIMDKKAGTRLFKGITFALQSLNPESLTASKRFNLRPTAIVENMEFYRSQDIPTYSEIIWPMPNETLDTLCQGLQDLINMGQRDFVMVHPLVLTPNAPMGQPEYIQQHGLASRRVPLDTFWLKIDDPEHYIAEMVDAVYRTRTVDLETTIQGHMISHWLVVLYYYGWAHAVMDYVDSKHGVQQIDFAKQFSLWARDNPQTLIGKEHQLTTQSIRDVFEQGTFWGRQIQDEVYWEYKSATSIVLHARRSNFDQELSAFLADTWGIANSDLIRLNSDLCFDWRKSYPITKSYDSDVLRRAININANQITLDHWDRHGVVDDRHFVHKAYHWQRKNRYWRCSVIADG